MGAELFFLVKKCYFCLIVFVFFRLIVYMRAMFAEPGAELAGNSRCREPFDRQEMEKLNGQA